jgi:hypothetical protein
VHVLNVARWYGHACVLTAIGMRRAWRLHDIGVTSQSTDRCCQRDHCGTRVCARRLGTATRWYPPARLRRKQGGIADEGFSVVSERLPCKSTWLGALAVVDAGSLGVFYGYSSHPTWRVAPQPRCRGVRQCLTQE